MISENSQLCCSTNVLFSAGRRFRWPSSQRVKNAVCPFQWLWADHNFSWIFLSILMQLCYLCASSHSSPALHLHDLRHANGSAVRCWSSWKPHPNAAASDCAPACALSSQSLTRTEAQSGCTKSGPFHGLRRYPVREAGPQHYEEKVGTEHTSSLPKEWPQDWF